MKKLLICVFILCTLNTLKAQDIAGSWLGTVNVGVDLHLGFNIKKTDTGYTATFDSPDQKAFGYTCNKTYRVKDSLFIEIATIGAKFKGLWDGKDAINGIFKQGLQALPLSIKRITAAEKEALTKDPIRPQTPKAPYGYYSEDVEYNNDDKSLHYGATFTRPNGSGKYPAVIIISGSGTQDRNGSMLGHKLYWVLADYLTKQGIAVLRVDDRGAGKSTLGSNFKNATSESFSHDVEASLNYLETRTDVDKKHLGLIGHSEGGIIAPMVAARRKDVSFIVLWGAPAVGGIPTIIDQNNYGLRKAGLDSTAVNAFLSLHKQVLDLFSTVNSADALDQKIAPIFSSWKMQQSQATLAALQVHDSSIIKSNILVLYNNLYNMSWMRFYITYKPETDLSKVKCSVLAVNGEKDTQVNAFNNLSLIKQLLIKNGNKDFSIMALPGLNHFLQTAVTGDMSEYEKIQETMSPVALNIISTWIKIHTK
ncbi:alpha/beta hydrolase family protein [Mucilaginibacter sp.]|uniref:alpha/beta hydrolase family protein n=1 Tax=Mucilaginibacter sp. TaxID=1882438 RepID=UPI003D152551